MKVASSNGLTEKTEYRAVDFAKFVSFNFLSLMIFRKIRRIQSKLRNYAQETEKEIQMAENQIFPAVCTSHFPDHADIPGDEADFKNQGKGTGNQSFRIHFF